MASHTNGSTRRGFLSVVTVGVGAAIGGTVAAPVVAAAMAPAAGEATFRPVSLGPVDGFTSESGFEPTAAPYVEDPAQPLVSSGLAYVHHTGGQNHDWLAPDAMFIVFSNRCTPRSDARPGRPGSGSPAPATEASSTSRGAYRGPGGAAAPRPLPMGDPARREPLDHPALGASSSMGTRYAVLPGEVAGPAAHRPAPLGDGRHPLPAGHLRPRGGAQGGVGGNADAGGAGGRQDQDHPVCGGADQNVPPANQRAAERAHANCGAGLDGRHGLTGTGVVVDGEVAEAVDPRRREQVPVHVHVDALAGQRPECAGRRPGARARCR